MRRGVKNNLGAVFLKKCVYGYPVFNIADHRDDLQIAKAQFQLLTDIIDAVLSMAQQDELPRLKFCRLTAEFSADGSPSPCYQYSFSGQVTGDGVKINLHRLTSQNIFNPDLADLTHRNPAVDELENSGQYFKGCRSGLADIHDLANRRS